MTWTSSRTRATTAVSVFQDQIFHINAWASGKISWKITIAGIFTRWKNRIQLLVLNMLWNVLVSWKALMLDFMILKAAGAWYLFYRLQCYTCFCTLWAPTRTHKTTKWWHPESNVSEQAVAWILSCLCIKGRVSRYGISVGRASIHHCATSFQ